jgi:glyceraldehyde-3-phosphate dehydrogenase (NADP+)
MANETAEAMVRDDRLAVLSFTGSAPVGWHLKSISGRKSVLLELGGNAPAIVLDDADTEYAATKLSIAGFAAAGQVCIKAQRLLIHEAIYEDFIQKFLSKVKSIKSGNPHEPDTIVGPVIDSKSADRIQAWVDEAITQGAKSLLEFHRDGNVISPVILTDTTHQMKVECDEVFGPVVVIKKIRGLDAAIDIANDSAFGLQAGVFTSNVNSIRETAQRLKFGGVIFNDSPMLRVDNFPYGGSRQSGLGREGVKYSMQEFTESRMIVVRFPGS